MIIVKKPRNKSTIRIKLQDTLNNGIEDEASVVYLLVQLRKLLEHESQKVKDAYFTLRLFCDWALHIQMDRAGAQRILRLIDAKIEGPTVIAQDERAANDMLELVSLRIQFRKYIRRNKLNSEIASLDEQWFRFLELYAQIIADSPLVCKLKAAPSPHSPLKHIDTATIRVAKVPPRYAELFSGTYPLWIKWYGYKGKRQVFMFEGFGRRSKTA